MANCLVTGCAGFIANKVAEFLLADGHTPSTELRAGSGIPCAALLADVPGFTVTGIQRRSERSGWKIDCLRGR
jgi:hypothetical protein